MQRKFFGRWPALVLSAVFLILSSGMAAQAALPRTYQEFKARYREQGRTPEGALKLYFEAVFCYLDEATRSEASKMLRYALHSSRPIESSNNLLIFVERLRDPDMHHIFRSFAAGATPGNNYRMSPDQFSIVVTGKIQESDFLKLFLKSGGADSPRPVWVKEYDGLWYTINNAGTYSGVRPPQSELDRKKNAHDADYDDPNASKKPEDTSPPSGKGTPENSDTAQDDNSEEKDDGEFLFK